jgi:UDP-N-acetylglucosamine 2-epimerase (non-hydrolysing)/UDP-GlcNAc3NAcA epimerase
LRARHEELLVHTGQHFDDALSAVFFAEFGLPAPELELGVALGSNTSQTARMLTALEPVLGDAAPDLVLVYGDTNSTLAGALAGAQAGVPVAHVEAGMRSFERSMPEELNRVLTDHVSALLLCSSDVAVANLRREGVRAHVELVGDVMVDVALAVQPQARGRLDLIAAHGVRCHEYVLATAHRAANVDDPARLAQLVELLLAVPIPVVFVLHPRTRARLVAADLLGRLQGGGMVSIAPPLGYLEFAALACNARAVMTDSGGVQKEAYLAAVPCITLRPSTEWTETVELGWNALVDLDSELALAALARKPPAERPPLYGDGHAGDRVVDALTLAAYG